MMISMSIEDKETGQRSEKVDIYDVIYNQYEIEFTFGNYGDEDYSTLPYKDFLFFRDDYDVIVEVEDGKNN